MELLETMQQVMVYPEAAKHCRKVLRSNIVQVVTGKLYAYDIYTLEHSMRVAGYAMDLAYANGMTRKDIVRVGIAGAIHDIGKIFVDIDIINKPGKLTDVEYEEVKKHVQFGVDWLKQRGIRNDILVAVGEHHEHLDGTGYPLGLMEDEISVYGRILAIADVYDAITVKRVYNEVALSREQAMFILLKNDSLDVNMIRLFAKVV
jgi:putative nucleotidyltransferase with HDIG domain